MNNGIVMFETTSNDATVADTDWVFVYGYEPPPPPLRLDNDFRALRRERERRYSAEARRHNRKWRVS